MSAFAKKGNDPSEGHSSPPTLLEMTQSGPVFQHPEPTEPSHPSTQKLYNTTMVLENLSVVSNVFKSKKPYHSPLTGAVRAVTSLGDSLKTEPFYRLKNVNTVLKGGSMVLVMGGPGDGTSTFLKAIAGKVPLAEGSRLSVNGINQQDLAQRGIDFSKLTTYADQSDENHLSHLTVHETIDFASKMSNPYHGTDGEENYTSTEKIIDLMGLGEAKDTLIGNATLKGISGGQRRRVTFAERLVAGSAIISADSYSDGLDSATTLSITQQLKSWTVSHGTTLVATLKQPPPEVVALFDHIIVLKAGEVIFDGPLQDIEPYFQALGFHDPNIDTADFIMGVLTQPRSTALQTIVATCSDSNCPEANPNCHLISPKQYSYVQPSQVRTSLGPLSASETPCVTKTSMVDFYLKSPHYQAVVQDVQKCGSQTPIQNDSTTVPLCQSAPITTDPNRFRLDYTSSTWSRVKNFSNRYAIVTLRNKPIFWSRIANALLMALLFGSLYWQVHPDKVTLRVGQLLLSTLQLSFSQMINIPSGLFFTSIAHKQVNAGWYSNKLFVVLNLILALPFSLLETVIYICVIYFMTGSVIYFKEIILSAIIIFLTSVYLVSWFQMTTVTQNEILSQAFSLPVTGFFMSLGGIFLFRSAMPKWIRYTLYHVSPFSWAIRALMNIEYLSPKYNHIVTDPMRPGTNIRLGDLYLSQADMWIGGKWIGWAALFLIGFSAMTMALHVYLLWSPFHEESRGTDRDASNGEDEIIDPSLLENAEARSPQLISAIISPNRSSKISSPTSQQSPAPCETLTLDTNSSPAVAVSMDVLTKHKDPLELLHKWVPIQPSYLTFDSLHYTIKVSDQSNPQKTMDRVLLQNISGVAQPGRVLALLGSSGAGKTTLLNLLSLKANSGAIQGLIKINNQPLTSQIASATIGFVEQFDTLYGFSTVFETILFAARMKLPATIPDPTKIGIVEEIMSVLNLNRIRDQLIGDHQLKNLSFAQRKLVSIGITLVASPSILFLDEPTTGLDAKAAAELIKIIRLLARSNVTIITTIHQPNTTIFLSFDDLLLLAPGGYLQYNGPIGPYGKRMAAYLESVDERIEPLPHKTNPSSWMLDQLSKFDRNGHLELSNRFKSSQAFTKIQEVMEAVHKLELVDHIVENSQNDPQQIPTQATKINQADFVKSSLLTQFITLLVRNSHGYTRSPFYIWARLFMVIALSVCFGLLYQGLKADGMITAVSTLSGIFIPLFFAGLLHSATTTPYHFALRPSFYREIQDGYYHSAIYYPTNLILELISVALAAVLTQQPMYFIIGLQADGVIWIKYLLVAFALITTFVTTAMMLQAVVPSFVFAQLFLGVYFCLGFIFSGLALPYPQIPAGYKWLYRGLTLGYSLEAAVDTLFSMKNNLIQIFTNGGMVNIPASKFIASYIGIEFGGYWKALLWVLIYNLAMICIGGLATTFLRFIKK